MVGFWLFVAGRGALLQRSPCAVTVLLAWPMSSVVRILHLFIQVCWRSLQRAFFSLLDPQFLFMLQAGLIEEEICEWWVNDSVRPVEHCEISSF